MLSKRTSSVNRININVLTIVSTLEIGDSSNIQAFSRAIAVQREKELFFANEGNFSEYGIFNEPIPFEPIIEDIAYETVSLHPIIKVQNIDILAVSTSSVIHIGNSKNAYLEARVKHIRQLEPREE